MGRALILTAKDVETLAVKEQLLGPQGKNRTSRGVPFTTWGLRSVEDPEVMIPAVEIALYQTGKGQAAAAVACGPIIEAFQPDVVLYVGCAGGDPSHTELGDILVATAVWNYEYAGIEVDTMRPKSHPVLPDQALLDEAKIADDYSAWRQRLMDGASNSIKIRFGEIASGNKVIKSLDSPLWDYIRRELSDDIIGCEMEGHGFFAAMTPFKNYSLMIRGVSDHLTGKGATGRTQDENQQRNSTSNAAAFACHLLETIDYNALRRARGTSNAETGSFAKESGEREIVAITFRTSIDKVPAVWEALKTLANSDDITISRVEPGSITVIAGMDIYSASFLHACFEGKIINDLIDFEVDNLISSARRSYDDAFDAWLEPIRNGVILDVADPKTQALPERWIGHARALRRRLDDDRTAVEEVAVNRRVPPNVIGEAKGVVRFFNAQKGFGFITRDDGGEDVFVHISEVEQAGLPGLAEGQPLEFALVDRKGRVAATDLKIEGDPLPVEEPAPRERGPQRELTGEKASGTVKFFNATKGFGFITRDDGQPDAFVHISAVERAGMISLNEGDRVEFEIEVDRRGKTAAVNLDPIQ